MPRPTRQADGVVLAAGLSRRAGRFKMSLPLGNRAVIQRAVEGMYDAVRAIRVVVGYRAERVEELLLGYPKVEIVPNPDFERGMFSSVKVGVAGVRAPHFLLLPGDMAMVSPSVYVDVLNSDGEIVIPSYRGKRGHPVLFDSRLIPEILTQPEGSTLRDVLREHRPSIVDVEDEGVLLDCDTIADYHSLVARFSGHLAGM